MILDKVDDSLVPHLVVVLYSSSMLPPAPLLASVLLVVESMKTFPNLPTSGKHQHFLSI